MTATEDHASAEPSLSALTQRLWAAATSTYSAILRHPFVSGLADGSLDRSSFRFYLVQDGHYLQGFARALALLAARAPAPGVTEMFTRHTAALFLVERSLHGGLLSELATTDGEMADAGPAPTTLAYTSYLITTCATGSFSDGIAAVLPCYWIYREVGRELQRRSSPDPLFARWIATYAGADFDCAVQELLDLTDSIGANLSQEGVQSAIDKFATAARYEWMFWEAAYQRIGWPL